MNKDNKFVNKNTKIILNVMLVPFSTSVFTGTILHNHNY